MTLPERYPVFSKPAKGRGSNSSKPMRKLLGKGGGGGGGEGVLEDEKPRVSDNHSSVMA